MAITIPPWLEWLEWVAGTDWPHGNEDLQKQMGESMHDLADRIRDRILSDADIAAASTKNAYPAGEGVEQMAAALKEIRSALGELANGYDEAGDVAIKFAAQIRSNKLNGIFSLAWLFGELMYAWLAGPGGPLIQATAIARTQFVFRWMGQLLERFIGQLLARLAMSEAAKQFLTRFVYEIVQEAVVEVIQGTSQEVLVQNMLVDDGFQDKVDWGAVTENAHISAWAGAAGGLGGHAMHNLMNRTPLGDSGWQGAIKGAVTGAGAGLAGAGGAYLATGLITDNWAFDPRMLTGGALSGMGPSMIYGARSLSDYGGGPMPVGPRVGITMPGSNIGAGAGPAPGGSDGSVSHGGSPRTTGDSGNGSGGTTNSGTSGSSANGMTPTTPTGSGGGSPPSGAGGGDTRSSGDAAAAEPRSSDTAAPGAPGNRAESGGNGDGAGQNGSGTTNSGASTNSAGDSGSDGSGSGDAQTGGTNGSGPDARGDGAGDGESRHSASERDGTGARGDSATSTASSGDFAPTGPTGAAAGNADGSSPLAATSGTGALPGAGAPGSAATGAAGAAVSPGSSTPSPGSTSAGPSSAGQHPGASAAQPANRPATPVTEGRSPAAEAGSSPVQSGTAPTPRSAADPTAGPQAAAPRAAAADSAAPPGAPADPAPAIQAASTGSEVPQARQLSAPDIDDTGVRVPGADPAATSEDGAVLPPPLAAAGPVRTDAAVRQRTTHGDTDTQADADVTTEPDAFDTDHDSGDIGAGNTTSPDTEAGADTRPDSDSVLPKDHSRPTGAERDLAKAALAQLGTDARAADLLHGNTGADTAERAADRARDNARWWNSLDADHQQAMIRTHPDVIGNAPGVDPPAADRANRLQVARELADLQGRDTLDRAQRAQLRNLLATERALAEAAARADRMPSRPDVRVLAFDSTAFDGKGRAAIAIGDISTADHVSWHVPGRGQTVGNLSVPLSSALTHHDAATSISRGGDSVATVAWIGYDVPSAGPFRGMIQVTRLGRARAGAELLVRDIAAVNAVRTVDNSAGAPTTRVFAHHYGVDVAKIAGAEGRLGGLADDVVMTGLSSAPDIDAAHFGDDVRLQVPTAVNGLYGLVTPVLPNREEPPVGVPTSAMYRLDVIAADQAGSVSHPGPDLDPDAAPSRARNNCGELALWNAAARTGNGAIAVPAAGSIGPEGMTADAVQRAAGGDLTPVHGTRKRSAHQMIADGLKHMGGKSTVLVVDEQAGPVDGPGVGSHAYVMYHDPDTGKLMVDDPRVGPPFEFDPDNAPNVQGTWGVFYGAEGELLRPRSALAVQPGERPVSRVGQTDEEQPADGTVPKPVSPYRPPDPVAPQPDAVSRSASDPVVASDPELAALRSDRPVTPDERALARAALDRLAPGAEPNRLLHDDPGPDLMPAARSRAAENAQWWDALNPPGDPTGRLSTSQEALVRVHPEIIGSADGVPATVRDRANRLAIDRELAELRGRPPKQLGKSDTQRLANLETTVAALADADRMATEVAQHTGEPAPAVHVLAYESGEFGGKGKAVVAFGDIDTANSVSWHAPGVKTSLRKLAWNLDFARNHYQVTAGKYDGSVASIAWLGYDAPESKLKAFRIGQAQAGGALLARDIAAFNAGRAARAAEAGVSAARNHVFGHSFGSTTVSAAGANARLRGEISTLTLAASPGAATVDHAREFGLGARNVYVATLASDPVTWIGGNRAGWFSRVFGVGIDPAVATFGARRVTAEYPNLPKFRDPGRIHTRYYDFIDDARTRPTEALENFGRIAADLGDTATREARRTGDGDANVFTRVLRGVPKIDPATDTGIDDGSRGHRGTGSTPARAETGMPARGPGSVLPTDPPPTDGDRDIARQALDRRADAAGLLPGSSPRRLLLHGDHSDADVCAPARAQARTTVQWWQSLSPRQQAAVLAVHPEVLGNADGIPAAVRDLANRLAIVRDLTELRGRDFGKLDKDQQQRIRNLETTVAALADAERYAREVAQRNGRTPPPVQLLSYDAVVFGGKGRAVLAFGDVDTAHSVSWHVSGMKTKVQELWWNAKFARNHYEATLDSDPDGAVTSIAWLGYDAPAGFSQAFRTTQAEAGGALLARDIVAFNATRAVAADRGGPTLPVNHVFGHSYGSTTASFAGRDGRLAGEVATITLAASPGAGPIGHAAQFGIGLTNVFVATQSTDPITRLGANRPGPRLGLGIDPSIEGFGARRLAAEYPETHRFSDPQQHHKQYYDVVDAARAQPTEALANFGRIAAGRADAVIAEAHRLGSDDAPVLSRVIRGIPKVDPAATVGSDDGTRGYRVVPHAAAPTAAVLPGDPSLTAREWQDAATAFARRAAMVGLDPGTAPQRLLVHPDYDMGDIVAVAEHTDANARWWQALSVTERAAVLRACPEIVGNADGIPARDRNDALRLLIRREWASLGSQVDSPELRRRLFGSTRAGDLDPGRRQMVMRLLFQPGQEVSEAGGRTMVQGSDAEKQPGKIFKRPPPLQELLRALTAPQQQQLRNLIAVTEMLAAAGRRAVDLPGSPPVQVLSYNSSVFHGDGRAVIAFGDVDTADTVSWLVPGLETTIRTMPSSLGAVGNHYDAAARSAPGQRVAAVAWLGYDAPSGRQKWAEYARLDPAAAGARQLWRDVVAFNAARRFLAARGGTAEVGNHLFGHGYGSTLLGCAGVNGLLAGQIASVTMVGSPGAGPMTHAREFGIGADNVYVATASVDRLAWQGADSAGDLTGAKRRLLGIDPATTHFGAVRVRAELPADPRFVSGLQERIQYFWFTDRSRTTPTEALANFARIATGHGDRATLEAHRPGAHEATEIHGRITDVPADPAMARSGVVQPTPQQLEAARAALARWAPDATPGDLLPPDPSGGARVAQDAAVAARRQGLSAAAQSDAAVTAYATRAREQTEASRAHADRIARWWDSLTDTERAALPLVYADAIAENQGLPATARDQANRLRITRDLEAFFARRPPERGTIESLLLPGELSPYERAHLSNLLETRRALAVADARAQSMPGRPKVTVLSYDATTFDHRGRAVVAIGDIDTADSVFWLVPGIKTTIRKLDGYVNWVGNFREAAMRKAPGKDIAGIVWIGYHTPEIDADTGRPHRAREGGLRLLSDVTGFHARRAALAETNGLPLPEHRIVGHSYGTPTTSWAATGGILAGVVDQIVLLASPGAGPMRHASDFGLGAANLYVATSTADPIGRLGGPAPGVTNRVARFVKKLGLGVDPTIEEFGARRFESELPRRPEFKGLVNAHRGYYQYDDGSAEIPTEPLNHVAEILAGRGDDLQLAPYRPKKKLLQRVKFWETLDPENTREARRQQPLPPWADPSMRESPQPPQVTAHRGGRALWAENTLGAFDNAMRLGVDSIELDVGMTRDGVPVIHHDQKIDGGTARDTGPVRPNDRDHPYVGKRISELDFDQIRTLDTGVAHEGFTATQDPLRGSRIPSLEEAARLAVGRGITLDVEIKIDPSWSDARVRQLVLATAEIMSQHGVPYRVRSFDWRALAEAAALPDGLTPPLDRVALISPRTATPAWMNGLDGGVSLLERARGMVAQRLRRPHPFGGDIPAAARAAGATLVSPDTSMVTAEFMRQAGDLPVSVWTVNSRADMARLVDLGVAELITDRPDLLRAVLADRGLVLPPPAEPNNDCAPWALAQVRALTGSSTITVPEGVGPSGLSASQLAEHAGGALRPADDHRAVADRLSALGDGAQAIVVDEYHGGADRHGVGAHAYVLSNENGRIVVRDLLSAQPHGFPPRTHRDIRGTWAVFFDRSGIAVDPRDPELVAAGRRDEPAPRTRIGATDPGDGRVEPNESATHNRSDEPVRDVLEKGEPVRVELLASGPSEHGNSVYRVEFADGSAYVYKPLSGQTRGAIPIPESGPAIREAAFYRMDQLFGFGLVPPTILWEGPRGLGSLMAFVADTRPRRLVDEYSLPDQHMVAVLDYVGANYDRNGFNYLTDANGRVVPIDNEAAFLVGAGKPGIRSGFVAKHRDRALDPDVLASVRAVDHTRLEEILTEFGVEPEAVAGAVDRLREIQSEGRITASMWPGRISDVPPAIETPAPAETAAATSSQPTIGEPGGARPADPGDTDPRVPDGRKPKGWRRLLGRLVRGNAADGIAAPPPADGSAPRQRADAAPWQADEDAMAARGPVVDELPLSPHLHVHEAFRVEFADGSVWVYKPGAGEDRVRLVVPESGLAAREIFVYRLDRLLRFGLVPPTIPYQGSHGPGSLMRFEPRTSPGRLPGEYSAEQRAMMAALDYISGASDRNRSNYLTSESGDVVPIDHGQTAPVDGDSFHQPSEFLPAGAGTLDRHGMTSEFVLSELNQRLPRSVLARVRALDPADLAAMMRDLGLEPAAVDGALARLEEIKRNGRITGESWLDLDRSDPEHGLLVPRGAGAGVVRIDTEPVTFNTCAWRALHRLFDRFRHEAIDPPDAPPGPAGMSAGDLENAAGGRLQKFGSHNDYETLLNELGEGAAVLVVDHLVGPVDAHGVGAHAYLITNDADGLRVYDPETGRIEPFRSWGPTRDTQGTYAVVYHPDGTPVRPVDEHAPASDRIDVGIGATDPGRPAAGRPLPVEVSAFIEQLRGFNCEAAALGAVAANVYRAEPRPTADIDLVIRALGDVPERLSAAGFRVTTVRDDEGDIYLIRLHGNGLAADIFVANTPVQHAALDRAADGVISIEDVIIFKLLAGRPKDRDDIAAVLAAGHVLDTNYIQRVAAEWELTHAWTSAADTAGVQSGGPVRRVEIPITQGDITATADSRRAIQDLMADWSDVDQRDAAELLTSELVGNVPRHAGTDGRFVVSVVGETGHRVLRVEVSDESPTVPARREADLDDDSGRGMQFLDLMSHAHGVDVHPGSEFAKTIWFELHESPSGGEDSDASTPEVGPDADDGGSADRMPWRMSPEETAALGDIVDEQPLDDLGNLFRVEFADGTVRVYRTELDSEEMAEYRIPASGLAAREAATWVLDHMLEAGLVPRVRLWQGGHGPGSLTDFVPHRPGLPIEEYPTVQRQLAAVLDYVTGHIDRNASNWATLPSEPDDPAAPRRLVLFDNTDVLPEGPESFTFTDEVDGSLIGRIRSPFVLATLNESLDPSVLEHVSVLDTRMLRAHLRELGIEPDAIEGMLARLDEIRAAGRITGHAWPGLGLPDPERLGTVEPGEPGTVGALLPEAEIHTAEIVGQERGAYLLAEERAALIDDQTSAKRRIEVTQARTAVRRALAALGHPDFPVLKGPKREPVWPDGVVGSITHKDGYYVAAVADAQDVRSIGIDAEDHEAMPEAALSMATLPEEMAWLQEVGEHGGVHWDRVLFSAKESVYKAWYPLTGRALGFRDAHLTFDMEAGTFRVRLLVDGATHAGPPLTEMTGRFIVRDGHILTAVTVPHEPVTTADTDDETRTDTTAADPIPRSFRAPEQQDLTPAAVRAEVLDNLRVVVQDGMRWNRERQCFVMPDRRDAYVGVGPVPDGVVASVHDRADGGLDITVSSRARDTDVARVVAGRLALAATGEPLAGPLAELKVLAAHVDRARFDPSRSAELAAVWRDSADLVAALDRHPDSGDWRASLAAPLSRWLALEEGGVLGERPRFGPDLTPEQYDSARTAHLDRLTAALAAEADLDVRRAESLTLHGRMREELTRRIFDPIFTGPNADAIRRLVPNETLYRELDAINAAVNDPWLAGSERLAALDIALADLERSPSLPERMRDLIDFDSMRLAAATFAVGPDLGAAVLDHADGRIELRQDGPGHRVGEQTTVDEFLRGLDRANQVAAERGLSVEYVAVIHRPVDGRSLVELLSRPQPQHRLPAARNEPVYLSPPRPAVPAAARGAHTIEVGDGRGGFGAEMLPAADRAGGGLLLQTFPDTYVLAAQRRRDLGILDPAPLTPPGSVTVFGDMFSIGAVLNTDDNRGVARVFVNNVRARLDDSAYESLVRTLSAVLAPGGRVEVQWTMKPASPGGEPGDRGHIRGDLLMAAVQRMSPEIRAAFHVLDAHEFPGPGNRNYLYTGEASARNRIDPPPADATSQPDRRMVIVYDPEGTHRTPLDDPAGTAYTPHIPHDRSPAALEQPTGDPNTAHLPSLRQHYIAEVEGLQAYEDFLRAEGATEEEIARALQHERREIGEFYKGETPEPQASRIRARNLEKYGDPLGPTVEYLRRKGLSWAQIIDGSKRPGGGDLGLNK
ncbi:alpha/beta hydrolase [Nocardia sp. CC227C]|uniref:alpha/beta hydrolase n=1 Tax=Nocardia sp. CC227C TaxID=3044562 RepID=UPI00278BE32C|nr:alpha/beta hydrolase [Nocardia sp. CC227C]